MQHNRDIHCLFYLGDVSKPGDTIPLQGPIYRRWSDVPQCMEPKRDGSSYCNKHHSTCYEKRGE